MDEDEDKQRQVVLTETNLQAFKDSQKNLREEKYARTAVTIGRVSNMLDTEQKQWSFTSQGIGIACMEDFQNLQT